MTITATGFSGVSANAASANLNPGSLASASGDVVVVIYGFNDNTTVTSQAAGTVTSTPAKTFTKNTELLSAGTYGLAVYSWVSDGTTLTQINVAPTGTAGNNTVVGGTLKVHSDVGTVTYDSTTKGTGTDNTAPFGWSAGGAVNGTQIGLLGLMVNNGAAGTFTPSSGYTMLQEFGDGTTGFTNHEAYKVNETGTPSLSVAYTGGSITDAIELFVSFKEPAGTFDPPLSVPPAQYNVHRM